MTQHEGAIHEIASEVDQLIIDPTVRARFTKHIDRFCKMVEDYGQALQSYAKKLERPKKRPDDRFQMMWWDKKFINIDTSVIYRPAEPVNPLLWFEIFDGAVIHRNPTKKEHLMRNYVLLAAIHDGELQEPFYRPLFSSKYDGKWFLREDFRERVREYYCYDANASPDKTRMFGFEVSEPESERLLRLRSVRDSVKADLASTKQNTKEVKLHSKKPSKDAIRDQVFICYSHKDEKWLKDLQTHLKPYVRNGSVTAWSDKKIVPGSKWFSEIKTALASAKVGVLLVTKDFLASDFIHKHELKPLLKKAEKGKVKIIWIPVRACAYKETPLKDYQAAVNPDKPLANMKKSDRDDAWVKICEKIKKAAQEK
jgi:hypothetical protein